MKNKWVFVSAAAAALFLPAPARAQQEHTHAHGEADKLGTVDFKTSCRPEVAAAFTRATALLHSFGYEEARKGFEDVAGRDPQCGIAYWGIAMTYYHPIWAPPNAAELAAGRAAAEKAALVGAKTDRERAYIAATSAFYREADPRARAQAFRQAMEDVERRFPADDEAAIFHALTLLATAPPSDATFANQKQAALVLNRLLPRYPDHPGIAHYVIHSFDYPALANDALPAARAYAKIAPASPHALHMPSHIFTRLGLWPESIASNLDSAAAGRSLVAKTHPGATAFDTLHALDYLEYAYLQMDDRGRARAVLEEVAGTKTFDEPNFRRRLRARGHPRALGPRAPRLEGGRGFGAADPRAALGPVPLHPRDHLFLPGHRRRQERPARARPGGTQDVAGSAGRSRPVPAARSLRLGGPGGGHAPDRGRHRGAFPWPRRRGPSPPPVGGGAGREDGQAPGDARCGPASAGAARGRLAGDRSCGRGPRGIRGRAAQCPESVQQPRGRGESRRARRQARKGRGALWAADRDDREGGEAAGADRSPEGRSRTAVTSAHEARPLP